MNDFIDQINISISENDLEKFKALVYSNEEFSWEYETEDTRELIEINFVQETEE